MDTKDRMEILANWKTLSKYFSKLITTDEVKIFLGLEIQTRDRLHIIERLVSRYISITSKQAKEEIELWSLRKRQKDISVKR